MTSLLEATLNSGRHHYNVAANDVDVLADVDGHAVEERSQDLYVALRQASVTAVELLTDVDRGRATDERRS